jgi:hypothetical protein
VDVLEKERWIDKKLEIISGCTVSVLWQDAEVIFLILTWGASVIRHIYLASTVWSELVIPCVCNGALVITPHGLAAY